jgi:hypothetical protein
VRVPGLLLGSPIVAGIVGMAALALAAPTIVPYLLGR